MTKRRKMKSLLSSLSCSKYYKYLVGFQSALHHRQKKEKLKIKEVADGRPTSKPNAQANCLRKIHKPLEEGATYHGSLPENGPGGRETVLIYLKFLKPSEHSYQAILRHMHASSFILQIQFLPWRYIPLRQSASSHRVNDEHELSIT